MSPSSREDILGRIRQALGHPEGLSPDQHTALAERTAKRPRGLIPERAQRAGAALVEEFKSRAGAVEATFSHSADMGSLPEAIAGYLSKHNLPAALRLAPHPDLENINWQSRPTLEISYGPSDGSDLVSVTRAFAGIAETGTLMLLAGPEGPTTLNFLPENHIVVLKQSELVGAYEDAWDRLRDKIGPQGVLSRVVNMITGPSRTGDIEQTIELGAHGPLRLHIVLVDDI